MTAAAATVQAFFTERLARQRRASPHTIAAYRDTLRLLLGFASQRAGTLPCRLDFAQLDAPVISAFLDWSTTGSVDTASSGTMVYEERTGNGSGPQEVHPGI